MALDRDALLRAGYITAEEKAASDRLFMAESERIFMAAKDRIMQRYRTEGGDLRTIMEEEIAAGVVELDALMAAFATSLSTSTQ